jgi:pyruvate dehydrogenase E1 component alpha subunit
MSKQKEDITRGIAPETLLKFHETMLLIRRFEEATVKGYQQKKIAGFLHTYIGSEAVGVGLLAHKQPDDAVTTTYRCHGLALALGMKPEAGMAELYGKITGCARGKGGSMHFFHKPENFMGGHGIVGGQFGPGIGAAFATKYQGKKAVSFIHFGDGATPQGTFHECMNLASLWDIPAIFVCEDNQYGMGTANHRALANTNIADFAAGYGIKGYRVNGMDVLDVYTQMESVINEVRETQRPVLLHMVTYRFMGHSVSDAGLYRSKDELNEWKTKDPIQQIQHVLMEAGIKTEAEIKEIDKEIKKRITDAVQFAEDSPEPSLDELTKHVFSDDLEKKQWQ